MPGSPLTFKANPKVIFIVLLLAFLAILCLSVFPVQAGVVSDVFGLDGFAGKIADDLFNGGCKLIGGTTYNLAKTFYDSTVGAVNMLTGEHTSMGKLAGWTKVGLNLASAGLIIYTLATGTATLPVIVTITFSLTMLKMTVDNIRNIDKLFSWLAKYLGDAGKSFLDVYKPNIYIYSDRDMEASVQLKPVSYITASMPRYDPGWGWKAAIFKGSIHGCNDYLFYEAKVPDEHFQRNNGFRISGCGLRSDLQKLMELHAFNARETADFVEYWENKLSNEYNYIFYPQGTETIEKIMPLTVVPAPETVCRMWFVIEKDNGQPVETAFSADIVLRGSFAVVEWGGVMDVKK